jgi:hypothetical protein
MDRLLSDDPWIPNTPDSVRGTLKIYISQQRVLE